MNIKEMILSITEDKFKSSYARLCTVDVVNDDYTILAIDAVWAPSAPDALVRGLMESEELFWDRKSA